MRGLFVVLFLLTFSAFSQDTVRVYFDFGSSKLNLLGQNTLTTIPDKYNLDEIDSLHIIGFADSVGRIQNNLRLSLKRAKNAHKFCKKFLRRDDVVRLYARGEGEKEDASLNRRVEVVIFYTPEVEDGPERVITDVDPQCFFSDFEALEMCNVRRITKKRKKYVHIEAMAHVHFDSVKHYYARTNTNGTVDIKRLKWKKKKTGILWWRKSRYVAEMPERSFDKFQFFTLADSPCDGCKEDIFTEDTIIQTVSIAYPDVFLMANAQTRLKLFGEQRLKIRVPREFIDLDEAYYAASRMNSSYNDQKIEWFTKKGKRRGRYYFAKVGMDDYQYPYIKKYGTTTVCRNLVRRNYSGNWWNWWGCGGMRGGGRGLPGDVKFDAKLGAFYQNDTVTGFFAIGGSYLDEKNRISAAIGINTHLGAYLSGQYDYHFYSYPLSALNPFQSWKSSNLGQKSPWIGTFYGGLEIKAITKLDYWSFVEPNAHLGISFSSSYTGGMVFYLKSGVGRDLLNRTNTKFYPLVEAGITLHFF
jgi:hypothetical protein